MTHSFDDAVRTAVLGHMNDDHLDDNLLITRAFGPDAEIVTATMVDFDGDGGEWSTTDPSGKSADVRVAWLGGPITERAEVRREIVALYDEACDRLGVEARPHA